MIHINQPTNTMYRDQHNIFEIFNVSEISDELIMVMIHNSQPTNAKYRDQYNIFEI